jgi:hypothetical protein
MGLTETFNTLDILADLGLTYTCDWCADEQPFPVRVKQGKMISVPCRSKSTIFRCLSARASAARISTSSWYHLRSET